MAGRNNPPVSQKQIERFKQRAKTLKKESNVSHAEALEAIARGEGFSSWKALIKGSESNQEDSDGI